MARAPLPQRSLLAPASNATSWYPSALPQHQPLPTTTRTVTLRTHSTRAAPVRVWPTGGHLASLPRPRRPPPRVTPSPPPPPGIGIAPTAGCRGRPTDPRRVDPRRADPRRWRGHRRELAPASGARRSRCVPPAAASRRVGGRPPQGRRCVGTAAARGTTPRTAAHSRLIRAIGGGGGGGSSRESGARQPSTGGTQSASVRACTCLVSTALDVARRGGVGWRPHCLTSARP